MSALSAYQQMRKANLTENTEFLTNYGLQAPVLECTSVRTVEKDERKKERIIRKSKKPKPVKTPIPPEERRSSFRIRLRVQRDSFEDYESLKSSDDEDDEDEKELLKKLSQPNRKIARPPRPNSYGPIEGVKVGTWWETRLDCNYDYIHRPTVAGIHQGPDGAYSVALSGGYEDDVDLGHFFTYTGEGGRDLKGTATNPKNLRTAPQSKHQTLTRGNLALSRNVETGNPVRVIRGYKLRSKFAPERGYRYDGLYNVVRYWEAVGKAGYKIFKYEFKRCDPEPAPWDNSPSPIKCQNKDKDEDQDEDGIEKTEDLIDNESNDPPAHEWHGWSEEPSLPNTTNFTLKLGDVEEQVNLKGDMWCRVSEIIPEENALTRHHTNSQVPALTMGSQESVRGGGQCTEENSQSELETCAAEGALAEDICNWPGWPEMDFSILDCPQSFNCILQDDF